jgi:hypothetical protein
MPLQYQTRPIADFSGGITDKYINAPDNKYKSAVNFIITERGLELRAGFVVAYDQEATQRIAGIWKMNEDLFIIRGANAYYFDKDLGTVALVATPNATVFFNYNGSGVYPNAVEWKDQLLVANTGQVSPVDFDSPMRIYRDNTGAIKSHELGLPEYPVGTVFNPQVPGAGKKYDYAIVYEYTYYVGDTQFKMVGVPFYKDLVEQLNPIDAVNYVNVQLFQSILPAGNRIDVNNVKIAIYRTKEYTASDFGVYYKVGEVANGFAGTFVDNVTDAALVTGVTLYTTGGQLERYKTPRCKYIIAVNDIVYCLYAIEETSGGDIVRPYRFYQMLPGTADGFDPSFYKDVDDTLTGGTHINGSPIIMTETYIYRVESAIDSFGNGNIRTRVISDSAGCLNHNSIVRTGDRAYFAGNNGFYVTDGFKAEILPVCKELQDSYRLFTNSPEKRAKIWGTYDLFHERIIWSMGDNNSENNTWWVYNINSGGFTTANGASFFSSSAIGLDNEIYRCDDQGYIYRHRDDYYNDVLRDTGIPAVDWLKTHVPFDFISGALDFGNPHTRKWVRELTVSTSTQGKIAYDIESINDDGRQILPMKEVQFINTIIWGDPSFLWGDPDFIWRMPNVFTKQRHFPRRSMRCRRKQIRIKPAKIILYKSDTYGVADVDYVAPNDPTQLVVSMMGTIVWPSDIVGDAIFFESEQYGKEHRIISRSNTTLVVVGGGTIGPTVGAKWVIKGYNKLQRFELNYLSYEFSTLDNEGGEFKTAEEGANE